MTLLAWWSALTLGEKALAVGVAWLFASVAAASAWGWWHVDGRETPWERRQRRQRRALSRAEAGGVAGQGREREGMAMSDHVSYVCLRAARKFGGHDGVFNAAGFSNAWQEVTGLRSGLDGRAVEAILHGRADVEPLSGSHFTLRQHGEALP